MNCHTTIQVSELLGATIHTRQASDVLLQVVQNDSCPEIDLDFSAVQYISRSFADQFHAGKMQLACEQQKTIIVTNANEEVMAMLQAVAKTQNKQYREVNKAPVYRYSQWNQLENFLLSL